MHLAIHALSAVTILFLVAWVRFLLRERVQMLNKIIQLHAKADILRARIEARKGGDK